MEGDDGCAAVEVLALQLPQGHHGAFAGDAGGVAEVIAVEDVVAHHQHLLAVEFVDEAMPSDLAGEIKFVAEAEDFFVVKVLAVFHGA